MTDPFQTHEISKTATQFENEMESEGLYFTPRMMSNVLQNMSNSAAQTKPKRDHWTLASQVWASIIALLNKEIRISIPILMTPIFLLGLAGVLMLISPSYPSQQHHMVSIDTGTGWFTLEQLSQGGSDHAH